MERDRMLNPALAETAPPAAEWPRSAIKRVIFRYLQPAILAGIVAFWWLAPNAFVASPWSAVSGPAVMVLIMALEWVNERHAHWRLTKREFFEGLFYILLDRYVLGVIAAAILYDPIRHGVDALGIKTGWTLAVPFVLQVALIVALHEFVQYWFHRLLHNQPVLWEVHVPHHYITQMNTMNAAVGNWIEILFLGLSLVVFFEMPKASLLCAGTLGGAVAYFAHSNIRFDPPRWYSYVFTTIEHHSLHHSLNYDDTRCNYANELIIFDRLFGTYRDGEAMNVGQDNQRRLSVWEQSVWPFLPYVARFRQRREGRMRRSA